MTHASWCRTFDALVRAFGDCHSRTNTPCWRVERVGVFELREENARGERWRFTPEDTFEGYYASNRKAIIALAKEKS